MPSYDFCNEEFTSYKKSVSCEDNPDITPINCRLSGYLDGYCLENDTTCDDADDDCVQVCYQDVNCEEETEIRPITFTCHGYFKLYQASPNEDSIQLLPTEMRICPDFYQLYPQFFSYDSDAFTPFIQFNPTEVEERS